MKTIKALIAFAGIDFGASSGQVITCSDEIANDVINAGYAVEVSEEPEPNEEPKKTARKRK